MSIRSQDLLNEYSKRQGVIENNTKILDECIKSVTFLKSSLTPDIMDIVNKYNPNLFDVLDEEKFSKLENVEEFKQALDYVLDQLFSYLEGMLL